MSLRWRLAATAGLLLAALGCGGNQQTPPPAPSSEPSQQQSGAPAVGAQVTGTVAPSLAPPASLITLEPATPVEMPVKSQPAIMDQAGYEFLPGFLVAQAGQTVQFRNSEDTLHNVRVSEATAQKPVFNVATAPFGRYEHTFDPGLYNVTCDIHPTMRATILVTATPYTAALADDGRFTIDGVPPGQYKLTVFAATAPVVREIVVKDGRTDLGVIQ